MIMSANKQQIRGGRQRAGDGAASGEPRRKVKMGSREAGRTVLLQQGIAAMLEQKVADCDAKLEAHSIAEEEKLDGTELVIHPWFVSGKYEYNADKTMIQYYGDRTEFCGLFPVFRKGCEVVTALEAPFYRVRIGTGARPLTHWGDVRLVHEVVETLIPEMYGKDVANIKYMTARARTLIGQRVKVWPGVDGEINSYINSEEFADAVDSYWRKRLTVGEKFYKTAFMKSFFPEGADTSKFAEFDKAYTICKDLEWDPSQVMAVIIKRNLKCLLLALKFVFLLWASYKYRNVYLFCSALVAGLFAYWSYKSVHLTTMLFQMVTFKNQGFSFKLASIMEVVRACSKGVEVPPLHPKAKIVKPTNWEMNCEPKNIGSFGSTIFGAPLVVPNCCSHDQYNGLRIRFLFDRTFNIATQAAWFASSKTFVSRFLPAKFVRYSDDEWLDHLNGPRRAKIVNALPAESLKAVKPVDIFVKKEAYLGKTPAAFKPRIIQGRHLSYQKDVGSYMYSVGKWVGEMFPPTGRWIYDSGLDAKQLGDLVEKCFEYKHVYELDVSNWDGSLFKKAWDLEKWLLRNCPERFDRFDEMLRTWDGLDGTGKHGVKFSCDWGRRSGDMHTSCFNSLINLCLVNFVLGEDTLAVAKGDDGFVGTNSELSVEGIIAAYAELGMPVKVKEVYHFSELGYCSGSFYPVRDGLKWGVNPFRVLAKFGLNMHNHPQQLHQSLLLGTAISMLPIAGHVPFLGTVLRRIIATSDGVVARVEAEYDGKNSSEFVDECTPMAVHFFCNKYEIQFSDFIALERDLSSISISDFPLQFTHPVFTHGFCVDSDCEVDCSCVRVEERVSSSPPFDWINCFVVPLGEELVKQFAPFWGMLMFGLFEFFLGSFWAPAVHFSFWYLGGKSVFHRFLLHSTWNCAVSLYRAYNYRCGAELAALYHLFLAKKSTRPIRSKKQRSQNSSQPAKKPSASLGRQALSAVGNALGGFLGGPIGSRIGDSGANWLSDVIGMGDYEIKDNSMVSSNGVPTFTTSEHNVRIRHREYLGDVSGSQGFQLFKAVRINPGDPITFPWLSRVAQNFQSYALRGCLFEFVSTSADALNSVNTALGTVVMATQYNPAAPNFQNKAEMEQYEFSCSSRPSKSLIHPVECDPGLNVMNHLYVRNPQVSVASEFSQLYDMGIFQLATTGMQASSTIGELWITYDVELFKPRIASGGTWPGQYFKLSNGPFTTVSPLGSIQRVPSGDLPFVVEAPAGFGYKRIRIPDSVTAGRFLVVWCGGAGPPAVSYSGALELEPAWDLNVNDDFTSLNSYHAIFSVTGYLYGGSYLEFNVGSSGSTVDVVIVSLP